MAIGIKEIKSIEAYAKNLTLTPASQATVMPPKAISIDVPRSGCATTRRTGETKATIGKNKNLPLLFLKDFLMYKKISNPKKEILNNDPDGLNADK